MYVQTIINGLINKVVSYLSLLEVKEEFSISDLLRRGGGVVVVAAMAKMGR
jgi:hypothetical protein